VWRDYIQQLEARNARLEERLSRFMEQGPMSYYDPMPFAARSPYLEHGSYLDRPVWMEKDRAPRQSLPRAQALDIPTRRFQRVPAYPVPPRKEKPVLRTASGDKERYGKRHEETDNSEAESDNNSEKPEDFSDAAEGAKVDKSKIDKESHRKEDRNDSSATRNRSKNDRPMTPTSEAEVVRIDKPTTGENGASAEVDKKPEDLSRIKTVVNRVSSQLT
jgi:hypothetical protein